VVQRGFLGVSISTLNADLAKEKGLNGSDLKGVYVQSVNSGSSAEEAGIKVGDIITRINGVAVNSSPELQEQVSRYHPGDGITVTFIREGKEKTVSAKLKNKQGNTEYLKKEETFALEQLGAELREINAAEKKATGLEGGVVVEKINEGTLSRNTNMREGFIITKVDNKVIRNLSDLKAALINKKGGVLIEGRYKDSPGNYWYAFGL
jgi:S1-C subfamily serine protease